MSTQRRTDFEGQNCTVVESGAFHLREALEPIQYIQPDNTLQRNTHTPCSALMKRVR